VPSRVDDSLRRMAMLDRADSPVRLLSRGMQQRVSIARANSGGGSNFRFSWRRTSMSVMVAE